MVCTCKLCNNYKNIIISWSFITLNIFIAFVKTSLNISDQSGELSFGWEMSIRKLQIKEMGGFVLIISSISHQVNFMKLGLSLCQSYLRETWKRSNSQYYCVHYIFSIKPTVLWIQNLSQSIQLKLTEIYSAILIISGFREVSLCFRLHHH